MCIWHRYMLFICLFVYLSIYLFIDLSIYLFIWHTRSIPEAKGKGTKARWARRDVYWEKMWATFCLSLFWTETNYGSMLHRLTVAYSNILAGMHHNHSTTLQPQHYAPGTLLAKYKVPQPNVLGLNHFAINYAPGTLLAKYKVPQRNALRLNHFKNFAIIW